MLRYLRRREGERRLWPAIRLWLVYVVLSGIGNACFGLMLEGILVREMLYSWLVSAVITLVLSLGVYSAIGCWFGELGFQNSKRDSLILLLVATILLAGFGFMANAIFDVATPNAYLVIIVVLLPLALLGIVVGCGRNLSSNLICLMNQQKWSSCGKSCFEAICLL